MAEAPDPQGFAEAAQVGQAAQEGGAAAAEAGGEAMGPGLGEQALQVLMATEPNPPIEQIQATWDVDEPLAYAIRGGNKMWRAISGGDLSTGMPAIADLAAAAVKYLLAQTGDQGRGPAPPSHHGRGGEE